MSRNAAGSFIVTVAGRRGGLAVTALATDLASLFAEQGYPTALIDADATIPAAGARLDVSWSEETGIGGIQPEIDGKLCQRCGACSDFCAFNALALLPGGITYSAEYCIGCGGCKRVCPSRAISEKQRLVGKSRRGTAGPHLSVLEARVSAGALSWEAAMVSWLRQSARDFPIQVIRAAPGRGRASREAWRGADLVLWLDDRGHSETQDGQKEPALLPGIEADRVIRISSRATGREAFQSQPAVFGESPELASALARTGRLLSPAGPWSEIVHALFAAACRAIPGTLRAPGR